jgi:hypothetical protein
MIFVDEVSQQKDAIQQRIKEAQEEASRTGKPLLILVGEAHANKTSTLNNMIAIEAARANGIQNLSVEYPEVIKDFKTSQSSQDKKYYPDGKMYAQKETIVTLAGTIYPDMHVTAIDGERLKIAERVKNGESLSYQQKLDGRNDAMAQRLLEQPEATIAVVGNRHLNALSDRLADKRTIVYLNTAISATAEQEQAALKEYKGKPEDITFLRSSNVLQAGNKLSGEGLATQDMLEYTMGKTRAQQATQRMESAGIEVDGSPAARHTQKSSFQQMFEKIIEFFQNIFHLTPEVSEVPQANTPMIASRVDSAPKNANDVRILAENKELLNARNDLLNYNVQITTAQSHNAALPRQQDSVKSFARD